MKYVKLFENFANNPYRGLITMKDEINEQQTETDDAEEWESKLSGYKIIEKTLRENADNILSLGSGNNEENLEMLRTVFPDLLDEDGYLKTHNVTNYEEIWTDKYWGGSPGSNYIEKFDFRGVTFCGWGSSQDVSFYYVTAKDFLLFFGNSKDFTEENIRTVAPLVKFSDKAMKEFVYANRSKIDLRK